MLFCNYYIFTKVFMNLLKIKKISSVILILSLFGQNFLFSVGEIFASNPVNNFVTQKYNRVKNESDKVKDKLLNKINSIKWLENAQVDLGNNLSIKSIRNINKKSSWDRRKDMKEILSWVDTKFNTKSSNIDFSQVQVMDDKISSWIHIRFKQTYKWIPVYWKEVVVHEDSDNDITSLSTDLSSDISIDTNAKISSNEAVNVWKNLLNSSKNIKITKSPILIIYPITDTDNVLAYNYEISAKNSDTNKQERWIFFIDANKWKVILHYNSIMDLLPSAYWYSVTISWSKMNSEDWSVVTFTWRRDTTNGTYFLANTNLKYFVRNSSSSWVYADPSGWAYRYSSDWGTSDPIEISAAKNIDTTLQFFKTNFNFTTSNIRTLSWWYSMPVRVHINMDNAYWDWYGINIGDWDWVTDGSLATLDVMWHEFSHGWTENTSNLTYYWEPWALNESFSDIMWANIEFYWQQDGTTSYPNKVAWKSDWLMWEDVAYSGAFRDMRDPQRYNQPSRYLWTNWYSSWWDNGWVHYNSSIQNFFYYLLVNGWSGNNDWISYSLSWIWLNTASDLAYRTNSYYMMPNYNYALARIAWINAANSMDVTWNLASSVKQAWDAVGVYSDLLDQYNNIIDYEFSSWSVIPSEFSSTWSALWSTDNSTWALFVGSLVSWTIWNLQTSSISRSWTTNSWYLWFWLKTSSEAWYDNLNFYIDNKLYYSKSGINPWWFYNQLVPGGQHTFSWKYKKDTNYTWWLDKAWIDEITLPIWSSWSFSFPSNSYVVSNSWANYISWSTVPLTLISNKSDSTIYFSWWDVTSSSYTFSWTNSWNTSIAVTSWSGNKNISATLIDKLWNSKVLTWSIIRDEQWPLWPVISSSGLTIFNSWSINLTWNTPVDSWIWADNRYYYELTNDYNAYFSTWIVNWTWLIKSLWSDWEYDFSIRWYDLLWNIWEASTGGFIVDNNSPTVFGTFLSWEYTNTWMNILKIVSTEPINYTISSTWITSDLTWLTNSWVMFFPLTFSWWDWLKTIRVDYSDLAGNTWSIDSQVTLDTTAPTYILNVYDWFITQWTSFTLTWSVDDWYSWVGSLSINWLYLSWVLSLWNSNISLLAGINNINFIFSDTLWNTTSTWVNIIRTSLSNNVWSLINSTWSALVTFNTDILSTGAVLYWTSSTNLDNYIEWSFYSTGHSMILPSLITNTTYYYKVLWKNLWFSWTTSNIYSFNTPREILDMSWTQVATWAVILSGATSSGIVFNSSSGTATIFSNDWYSSVILNLGWLAITASWADWDWILQWPEIYNTWLTINDSWYAKIGSLYEIWNFNSSLSLSWNSAIVSIYVWASYNSKTLRVYRSEDKISFANFTSCVVSSWICQFNTDHFSLFALWEPADSTPDWFSIGAITNSELSQVYTSNTIVISWINIPATVTISTWSYMINSWSYVSQSWTVNNGDRITMKLISSSSYSTQNSIVLNIWWVPWLFYVTTKAEPISSGWWGWWWGGGWWIYISGNSSTTTSTWSSITTTSSSGTSYTVTNSNNPGTTVVTNTKRNIKKAKLKVDFSDTWDSFAKDDINILVDKWIIKWFSDGTFRPNNNATRAEFLAITMKSFNIDLTSTSPNSFSDIDSSVSWIKSYVIKAKELGIISWQTISWRLVFRPNDSITRAEALAILFKIANIDTKSTKTLEFKDEFNSWMIPYVIKAKELGIISWQTISWRLVFRPNDSITRAETSRIIIKTLWIK